MAGTDYVVDVDNASTPLDSNVARKAPAELRALKAKVANFMGGSVYSLKNRIINGDKRIDQLLEFTASALGVTSLMCADTFTWVKQTVATAAIQTQALAGALSGFEKIETLKAGSIVWRGVNTKDELQEAEKLFLQVR